VIGYLGRADILAARMRHHEAEEERSRGPLLAQLRLAGTEEKLEAACTTPTQ